MWYKRSVHKRLATTEDPCVTPHTILADGPGARVLAMIKRCGRCRGASSSGGEDLLALLATGPCGTTYL